MSFRAAVLAWLLACSLPLSATGAGLSVGVVGGSSRASISGDKPPRGSYSGGLGYSVGLALDVDLGDHVVLTLQPRYVQRNTDLTVKRPTPGNPKAVDVREISMSYVSVPLLAQYVFGERGVRFFIAAGAEVLFLQDAQIEDPVLPRIDIAGELADTNLEFDVALGIRFLTGKVRWSVEARFGTGLVDLAEGDPLAGEAGEDIVWKSRSTQLLASATFPLF